MFKFIRRVSTSLLPRPDRPWRDDATSNAPTIGRKRRFSFTEDEDSASQCGKKARGESVQAEADSPPTLEVPEQKEGEDVKSVTQGVKDVELEDQADLSSGPEEIPLPDSPGGTPPPDIKLTEEAAAAPEEEAEQKGIQDDSDADSVASSSGEVYEQGQPEDDPNNDIPATSPLVEDAPTVDGIHSDDTPTSTETDV
ncbi:hypothetical protein AZE42_01202 [Rhizopogon vesiculosus]|uniref:Uncharacterized protein n=1 Tax=Rhizopogon vesiculosus TaxID=180088 RepID=A0A1J8Q9B9_9AGAM|nr:hypothetical protein AZE42_01202 [Rhizopogon vesiculosus]